MEERFILRALGDAERRRMLSWSALLCAVPLCLIPLAGRSSFELASEQAAFNARFATPAPDTLWHDKPLSIARDPFIPETASPGPLWSTGSVVGMQVTQGQPIGFVLPVNRGAAGTPVENPAQGPGSVTAIVTGPSPRALIDDGSRVRVVGDGDMLAGSRVAAIDGAGVHLQNGTLLPLAEDRP